MTTINNDQSLIEKVGGIVRAREIIYQAVGTATHFNVSNNHYAREVLRNRNLVWARYDRSTQSWFYDFSDQSRVCLNDLRTAIAKHDEFKVGDLVVPIDWRYTLASGCCRYTHAFVVNTNPFQLMSEEGDMYWNCTVEAVGYRLIKTNVDLPIAVVNRMKREGLIKNFDTTDHVTDIRNHVSPSTKVVDYE